MKIETVRAGRWKIYVFEYLGQWYAGRAAKPWLLICDDGKGHAIDRAKAAMKFYDSRPREFLKWRNAATRL